MNEFVNVKAHFDRLPTLFLVICIVKVCKFLFLRNLALDYLELDLALDVMWDT